MQLKKLLLSTLAIASCYFAGAQWSDVGINPLATASGSYTNLTKDTAGNYYLSYYGGGVTKGSVRKFNGTSWSFCGTLKSTLAFLLFAS